MSYRFEALIMSHEMLDNEETLRLALAAMQQGQDTEAVGLLKTLLERNPGHVYGRYLLAAQHAQMGLLDRAEAGFRAVVADAPEFAVARFQLGQLLLVQGGREEAACIMERLVDQTDALGAYSRGLLAEDPRVMAGELAAGLALPQAIAALTADMQRLHAQLLEPATGDGETMPSAAPTPPVFLTGYGRS
jgi:predicted Zn-dependent protease